MRKLFLKKLPYNVGLTNVYNLANIHQCRTIELKEITLLKLLYVLFEYTLRKFSKIRRVDR